MTRRLPELLLPAGDLETLTVALHYGADAVYLGGEEFSLRAKAKNFTYAEMREGIAYAHARGKKVYVTANIFAHNRDLNGVRAYFRELASGDATGENLTNDDAANENLANDVFTNERIRKNKPDALIISDPGIFRVAREVCPEIEVHISTQSNNTNYETFRFWHGLGAKRVVSARELTLSELKELREKIPEELEIETFVHGAMCISYSGRCLLSNYFTGRDANQGSCTHPCRWKYAVMEETRPGEYLPVEENERGTYIFNSRDLCMIEHLPELLDAGVDSLKIEGRMKTPLYVATVARAYRRALDALIQSEEAYRALLPELIEELSLCTHRPYGTGFFFGRPEEDGQIYKESTYESGAVYLGVVDTVEPDGTAVFTQKNKFSVGEVIEILKPDGMNIQTKVLAIRDADGQAQDSAPHASQRLFVTLEDRPEKNDVLRRRRES